MNRESRSGFSAAAWTGTFKNQSVQDEESFRIFRSIEFESLNAKQAALRGFLCFWRNCFYERKRRKWLLRSGFLRWVFKGVEKKSHAAVLQFETERFRGKGLKSDRRSPTGRAAAKRAPGRQPFQQKDSPFGGDPTCSTVQKRAAPSDSFLLPFSGFEKMISGGKG